MSKREYEARGKKGHGKKVRRWICRKTEEGGEM
jgi:hypothetical protein